MFGYATDETEELMPMPIILAHRITRRLSEARKQNLLPYLRPDGKAQVTVEYREGKPIRIATIVVSTQHSPEITLKEIKRDIIEQVIHPIKHNFVFDLWDVYCLRCLKTFYRKKWQQWRPC
jgi:S-adenosylmethionine synthetase